MGPNYNGAFIAPFRYRFNPESFVSVDSVSLARIEVACFNWVTAFSFEAKSEGAEMLKEAFVASTLNLLSSERNEPVLSTTALTVYGRSLRRLREGLIQFSINGAPPNSGMLYATAMILALSELFVNKSSEDFAKHVRGIAV